LPLQDTRPSPIVCVETEGDGRILNIGDDHEGRDLGLLTVAISDGDEIGQGQVAARA
jgi:hypothetical protein